MFLIGTVLAEHLDYPYTAMELKRQREPDNTLPENYISSVWARGGTGDTNLWFSGIRPDLVRTAVSNWTGTTTTPRPGETPQPSVSQLKWTEADHPYYANVQFRNDYCAEHFLSLIEYPGPMNDSGWFTDAVRGANYWDEAMICVNFDAEWETDAALAAVIAHELGHLYGLNERVDDRKGRPRCNDDEKTIMDAGGLAGPCDGITVHQIWMCAVFTNCTAMADCPTSMLTRRAAMGRSHGRTTLGVRSVIRYGSSTDWMLLMRPATG